MKSYHPLLLLITSLFCAPAQAAPFFYFEHYTTGEGLPSNTIHCTYQDRFGFVWIGTRDGLTRFDGYDFRSPYEPGADRMANMACMDIGEDEDGLIWFATSEGVGWYNPYTGLTESLGRLGVSMAFDLQPDQKGNVWIAGDKIYRYIKEDGLIRECGGYFAKDADGETAWVKRLAEKEEEVKKGMALFGKNILNLWW